MSLIEEEAKNLRDGDIILVPMLVKNTNGFFDKGMGVKVTCLSPGQDYRMREEREKGPQTLDIMTRGVRAVALRVVRLGDWVKVGDDSLIAFVVHVDGDDITVKYRSTQRNHCLTLKFIERILEPDDLTADEKRIFKCRTK